MSVWKRTKVQIVLHKDLWVILMFLLLCGNGSLHDSVDVWERNTVLCQDTGKAVLTQHVWWSLETHNGVTDYFCREWRLEKDVACTPERINGEWVGVFRDGKDKVKRIIHARVYRETETWYDVERNDAERFPVHRRRGFVQ